MGDLRVYTCVECGVKKTGRPARDGGCAMPSGWKSGGGGCRCAGCWKSAYAVRAVTLPAVAVLGGGHDEFVAAMRDAFRLSTGLYNWGVRRLLAADSHRLPGMKDVRDMPRPEVNLYKEYNVAGRPLGEPGGGPASQIFSAATKDYLRCREAALWSAEQALPLKRFPAPFPVRAQELTDKAGKVVKVAFDEKGRPLVTFRLHAVGSGPSWTLRLAGGRDFARQLSMVRQLLSGEARVAQMDLYTKGCGAGAAGIVINFRKNSGGQRMPCRLMVKLVGSFPRQARGAGAEVMLLRTDPAAFLVAEIRGRVERPWILNGDHVAGSARMCWLSDVERMRLEAEGHAVWLQRVGEDRKYEKRWPAGHRRQFADAYAKRCEKHRRRVNTWIGQMAAQVAGFARRRNVGEVLYDDGDRAFADSFPWYSFREALSRRLEDDGIRLTHSHSASGEVVAETPSVSRDSEGVA